MAQIVQIVVFGLPYIWVTQGDTDVPDIAACPNHRTTTSSEHFSHKLGYNSFNPEDGGSMFLRNVGVNL
jgi:hypothetical protein